MYLDTKKHRRNPKVNGMTLFELKVLKKCMPFKSRIARENEHYFLVLNVACYYLSRK